MNKPPRSPYLLTEHTRPEGSSNNLPPGSNLGEGYPHTSSINALLNEEPEIPVSTSAAASASGSSTVQDKLVTYLHENGGVATFVAIGKSPFIKAALADARVADPKIKLLSFLKKMEDGRFEVFEQSNNPGVYSCRLITNSSSSSGAGARRGGRRQTKRSGRSHRKNTRRRL
jgi:hypothetical protein